MQARDPLARAVAQANGTLRQGLGIAEVVERAGLPFADTVGPHLRHVVEHYEALLAGLAQGVVDYDHRPRERRLETDPQALRARGEALLAALEARLATDWPTVIAVALDGGLDGAERFVSASSPLRELMFVASHAVHHYALLRRDLQQRGLVLPESLGKAPATLRHERESAR